MMRSIIQEESYGYLMCCYTTTPYVPCDYNYMYSIRSLKAVANHPERGHKGHIDDKLKRLI